MAGLMLATTGLPAHVCLTDGNPTVVKAIQNNIRVNKRNLGDVSVAAEPLLFASKLLSEHGHLREAFDIVFAADCTINLEIHDILLATIEQILVPGGVFIYLAPRRGKSLGKFVKKAKSWHGLEVETETDYDEKVLASHHRLSKIHGEKYDEKKNYPILVKIHKVERKRAIDDITIFTVGPHGTKSVGQGRRAEDAAPRGARFWTARGSYSC